MEMEDKSKDKTSDTSLNLDITNENGYTNIQSDFYVPPNPILFLLVSYGMYLLFHAWISPSTIPYYIPFGSFAKNLGENHYSVITTLSIITLVIHKLEAFYSIYLTVKVYKLKFVYVVLWFLNSLFFGIFALWPLAFPKIYFKIRQRYFCKICCCSYSCKRGFEI